MRFINTIILCASLLTASHVDADNILDFAGAEAATLGVQIKEIATGKTLAVKNENVAMTPASILKCVTTASTLIGLGPEFRFATPVYLYGGVTPQGVLRGNVVIKAAGDPTVESGRFAGHPRFVSTLTQAVLDAGIRVIEGDVIIDDCDMPDQGQSPQWLIEDTAWDYGAGWYAFNYAGNAFTLNLSDMSAVPSGNCYEVVTCKADTDTDMLRGVNSDLLSITGRRVNDKNYKVSVSMDSPAACAIPAIRSAFAGAGIEIIGNEEIDTADKVTRLMVYYSPVASDIMGDLMRRSDNLMAEGMLRALAPESGRHEAIAEQRRLLTRAGVDMRYTKIVDGSGLARTDRVTPQFMTDVLTCMALGDNAATYTSFFPKVGLEGTVKNLLKNTRLSGHLVLKSGSMNGIHCYAGYKTNHDGLPTHTVVIMVNNFFCRRSDVRSAIERLLLQIF